MRVSIIVATLNRKKLLEQCLHSLIDQTYRDFEIIVVDGGSTDGSSDLSQLLPVRFVKQEGSFQPSGWNYGVRLAKGEVLVFVDDDIIAAKDWLAQIVATFASSTVAGVGGRVIQPDLGEHVKSTHLSFPLRLRYKIFSAVCEYKLGATGLILRSGYVTPNLDRATEGCLEVQTFQGCNMAFKRSVFEAVGLFDESYVPSAFRLETEFCLRAFAHGFRLLYNPNAVVHHRVHSGHLSRPQGRTLGRRLFYNSFNNFLFVIRGRKRIPRFSWTRFFVLQLMAAEESLRLAVRRKRLAYLQGPYGSLVALESWISNANGAQVGRIPQLQARYIHSSPV